VVKSIKHLPPELEGLRLREFDVLEEGEVEVDRAGTDDGAFAGISVASVRNLSKGGRVEPLCHALQSVIGILAGDDVRIVSGAAADAVVEVAAGIKDEANSLAEGYADIQIRMYAGGGEGEREAFTAALDSNVDGIITWSGEPKKISPLMRLASRCNIPVLCVGTDVPRSERLAVVSVDTQASGAIAADLLGLTLHGRGKVAITIYEISTMEHAEKLRSFQATLRSLYPEVKMLPPIEDHNLEALAYERCRKLFLEHPDLGGI
jgi:ABC-type sugar transport system substrate-binding protein